ncbi:MAG: tetratricopeptide repeat protein [Defluviitaleaceae bacterium]|nr:tetratricopeptide repeat protein [Defluviitaleaceae bacterium]
MKIDSTLHSFAVRFSNKYYNIGLKHANSGDMTMAIAFLDRSISINKKNTLARNLLGLCYYNVGRVGEALKEWIISSSYKKDDNHAQKYLEAIENNPLLLERCSEGLAKYNEALAYVHQSSEDLASICLKRAIDIVPNFVDALNLLALCHLKSGDRQGASALVEKALAIDKGNKASQRYYKELFKRDYVPQKKTAQQKPATAGASKTKQDASNKPQETNPNPFALRAGKPLSKISTFSSIIYAVVGMVIMFLFMHLLIFPGMLSDRDEEISNLISGQAAQEQRHAGVVHGLNQDIQDLEEQVANLMLDNQTEHDAFLSLQHQIWTQEAATLLEGGQPAQALISLDQVDVLRLPEDLMVLYAQTLQAAIPLAEQHYNTQGQALFNAGNFEDARIALERGLDLSTPASNVGGNILYLLGRIAENDEDIPLAISHYQALLDDFPASPRANAARNRLSAIQE